jgi:hypothetical protein
MNLLATDGLPTYTVPQPKESAVAQRLNQVVAVVSTQKSELEKVLTDIYHLFQKEALFTGFSRVYTPKDETGDTRPPEKKLPQASVRDLHAKATAVWKKTLDSIATQDWANCQANADIVVDQAVLLEKVPVTHLMILEHHLGNMKAYVEKMPTRDPAETWAVNDEVNGFVSDPARTEKTEKLQEPITLVAPTDKHPGQAQLITRDRVIGFWDTRKYATAVSARDKDDMLARIVKLQEAVKVAREQANNIPAEKKEVAGKILDFVFGDAIQ